MIPGQEYRAILERMPVLCVDAIIQNNKSQYLLVRRTNEPLKGEYWVPGGRVLKNETLHEAVIRKVRQELGVNSHVVMPVGIYEDFFNKSEFGLETGLHTVSMVFLMIAENYEIHTDNQSDDWGWYDELPERLSNKIINIIPGGLKT